MKVFAALLAMSLVACQAEAQRRDPPALGLGRSQWPSVTNESIAKDLVGQIVKVDGKDWEFSHERTEYTKVKIQEFTPYSVHNGPNKPLTHGFTVKVEVDAHLC